MKAVSFVIGLVLIVGIGSLVYFQTSGAVASDPARRQTGEGMAAAEIARHAGASSCWSSINGNVYDLTSWIPPHPGGPQTILQLCGTDGSAKFNSQHGGSAMQEQALAGFKIGVLAK